MSNNKVENEIKETEVDSNANVLTLGLLINEDERNYLNKYFEFVRKMQNYFISYELKKFNRMYKAYDGKYERTKRNIEECKNDIIGLQREIKNLKSLNESKDISKDAKKVNRQLIKDDEKKLKDVKACQKNSKKEFFDLLKEFEISKYSFISDLALFDKIDYFTKPVYKSKNGKLIIDKNGNKVPILDKSGNPKRKCFVGSTVRSYSIALPIWSAFEKKINEDSVVHFKRYRNKSSINSIAFPVVGGTFNDNNSFKIPSVKKTLKYRKPKTQYEKEMFDKEKISVIRIKRIWDNTKYQYSVQFTVNTPTVLKKDKSGNIKHPLGNGTAGLGIGLDCVWLCTNDTVKTYSLIPPDILNIEKEIKNINKAMDRSKRATNPNNYDIDGKQKKYYERVNPNHPEKTIKSKLRWKYSNHYNKLSQRKAYLEGVNARKRTLYAENLANEVLNYFDSVNIQKPNFKWMQMSKKKISANDNEENADSRSIGSCIKDGAPAQFINILTRKVESRGGTVNVINTYDYKTTEFCHLDNEYHNISISEKWFDMGDGNVILKDAHTAFNLLNMNDINKSNKSYNDFLKNYYKELEKNKL